MKSFLLRMLGVGFIIMSEISVAATGSNLLLETSQGQIEIKLLPTLPQTMLPAFPSWRHLDFMTALFSTVSFQDLWRKQVTQQAPAWADREVN